MSLYSINDPKHWLDRAKEARALAEHMDDPEAKRTMLKNADDYERLAQRAEGEVAEAVTDVTANELLGQRMRPGDVRQHG
jgi:hypothetical protein